MALGTSLTTLQSLLKAEIGNELSVVTAQDTALATMLLVGQRDLADRFDWPHLKKVQNVGVDAVAQYVTLPVEINFDRPVRVAVQVGSGYQQVNYGIDEQEYNSCDYANGATGSPIQRWQRYDVAQFEVWPVGAAAQVIRFVGQKRLADISASQVAQLDDLLVVFYVASQYLTRLKSAQAPLAIAKFRERFSQLQRNAPRRSGIVVLGGRIPALTSRSCYNVGRFPTATAVPGDTSPFFGSDTQNFGTDEAEFGFD